MDRITLHKTNNVIEGDKRQHLPFLIRWKCAQCGEQGEKDFSSVDYISYCNFGAKEEITLHCDLCEYEEKITVLPTINLELISTGG